MLKTLIEHKYKDDHPEEQYLDLIRDLLREGSLQEGRNGRTICSVGSAMYFSLKDNTIPILTTKKVAVKTCLKELIWFIRGCTDNRQLKEQNVHIWDLNGSEEFLRERGLSYPEDDLGPVYGHQWRHFNAPYNGCCGDYTGRGIDQLQRVINDLMNPETRTSRRHIVSAWNPCQIDEMALPPCHVMFQFHVTQGNKLSCSLYQRSGDVGLGVPFNIMSYSALTHLIAFHCNLEAHEFIYYLGNAHIYENHVGSLEKQILRKPYPFPKFFIKNKRDNIDGYTHDDFVLCNYDFHPTIKMDMVQ
jgi:thymidylate synthase